MTREKFSSEVQRLIAEQQQVQQVNPPSSIQWKRASAEIRRLVRVLLKELSMDSWTEIAARRKAS